MARSPGWALDSEGCGCCPGSRDWGDKPGTGLERCTHTPGRGTRGLPEATPSPCTALWGWNKAQSLELVLPGPPCGPHLNGGKGGGSMWLRGHGHASPDGSPCPGPSAGGLLGPSVPPHPLQSCWGCLVARAWLSLLKAGLGPCSQAQVGWLRSRWGGTQSPSPALREKPEATSGRARASLPGAGRSDSAG